jgi:hypothetical protein
MGTGTREEIQVAVFEVDVPAGARVPVAHSREVAVLDAAAGWPPDLAAVAAVMRHSLTPVP